MIIKKSHNIKSFCIKGGYLWQCMLDINIVYASSPLEQIISVMIKVKRNLEKLT